MPYKPMKPCGYPMCKELTNSRFCDIHRRQYEKERGTSAQRGYDRKWQIASKRYLREHPLCVECLKNNKLIESKVVDHIIPHRGDKVLFWNELNWQALCKRCHDKKTVTKDMCQEHKY